jgi:hypothetical protein
MLTIVSNRPTPTQDFPLWVKTLLLHRRITVSQLAKKLGRNRSTVSTAIHNADRFPRTREAIRNYLRAC